MDSVPMPTSFYLCLGPLQIEHQDISEVEGTAPRLAGINKHLCQSNVLKNRR